MNKPVIATRHGGSLETVVDNVTGWLVPPDQPVEMAAALKNVLDDKHRSIQAGELGRKRVIDHFSAERMCENTLSIYKQLTGV